METKIHNLIEKHMLLSLIKDHFFFYGFVMRMRNVTCVFLSCRGVSLRRRESAGSAVAFQVKFCDALRLLIVCSQCITELCFGSLKLSPGGNNQSIWMKLLQR